ncbi:hypothetical protein BJ741DRAFT_119224 [Chytriomyces cf. hyalinus JEL632]|nr:hypothetical protein BJ741DRAFT_119224 [Chytriomyces cf. hyalinus JEL632]
MERSLFVKVWHQFIPQSFVPPTFRLSMIHFVLGVAMMLAAGTVAAMKTVHWQNPKLMPQDEDLLIALLARLDVTYNENSGVLVISKLPANRMGEPIPVKLVNVISQIAVLAKVCGLSWQALVNIFLHIATVASDQQRSVQLYVVSGKRVYLRLCHLDSDNIYVVAIDPVTKKESLMVADAQALADFQDMFRNLNPQSTRTFTSVSQTLVTFQERFQAHVARHKDRLSAVQPELIENLNQLNREQRQSRYENSAIMFYLLKLQKEGVDVKDELAKRTEFHNQMEEKYRRRSIQVREEALARVPAVPASTASSATKGFEKIQTTKWVQTVPSQSSRTKDPTSVKNKKVSGSMLRIRRDDVSRVTGTRPHDPISSATTPCNRKRCQIPMI